MSEAFVYMWHDSKNSMYYIGSHKGTPDDGYTHSSKVMEQFKAHSIPEGFSRRILAYGTVPDMRQLENDLLNNRKEKCWDKYYNVATCFPPPVKYGKDAHNYIHGRWGKPEYQKEYRENNREKIREQQREYYKENREKLREYQREYREKNPEYKQEYLEKNREKIREQKREYMREYYEKNREKIREYREKNREKIREYCEKNSEKIREQKRKFNQENPEYMREYYEKNREKILERKRKNYKKKQAQGNLDNFCT